VQTNFFDDFPQLEFRCLRDSARLTAVAVMKLLGWKVSRDAKKDMPFASSFVVLGVSLSFQRVRLGEIVVSHKPRRVEDLKIEIAALCDRGRITPAQAASVRGKLLYSAAQCFGRGGALATSELGFLANHKTKNLFPNR
jgi:hypothetical protein